MTILRQTEKPSRNRSEKINRLRKVFLSAVAALFFGGVAGLGVAKADLPTSGLVLRLDASTITGLADGAEVTSWAATVGGATFTNFNDSSKPQYYSSVANLNGQAALYFDADCMTYSGTFGVSGAADRTVIAVWADSVNTGSNYQHVLHMGTNSTNQAYGLSVNRKSDSGGDGAVSNHYWGSGFNAAMKAGAAGNTAALVFASGTDKAYVNGWYGGKNTPAAQNTATNTTLIGSRLNPSEGGGGSREGIKGYVAEVLIYDRALSSAEISQVSQYVVDKYGLSSVNTQALRELSTTGAQINLDFTNNSVTGGTYTGVMTDEGSSDQYLRLINQTGSLNNYAYLTGAHTGSDKITGSFDLRFTSATADGVSLVLAGSGVDITKNYGNSPNGETPSFAGSFGIGYTIYNKNQISVFWDGNQLGVINTADGSNYNLKGGSWFTTQFEIEYGEYGVGADVYVQLFDKTTNEAVGFFSTYVPSMSAANNQLLLRGRTGGSTANADFDNIQISYSNLASGKTWIADKSGSFIDGANWEGGVAPAAGDTVYISGGTQTITGGTLNLRNGVDLVVTGGATTTGASGIAAGSTLVIRGGSLATTGSMNFRVGEDGSGEAYVSGSGTATLTIGGGTMTADRWLSVGYNNDGVVNVYGGTLKATSADQGIILGDRAGATGTLNQYDGTVSVTGTLSVGPTGKGVVNVEGGTLTANVISMGDGEFNISGGTVNATNGSYGFRLGNVAGKTSTVNQTNGTVNVAGRISVGSLAGSTGVYNLSGGTLNISQYLMIGNSGDGTLNVDGARVNVMDIIMGETPSESVGILNITNGGQVWGTGYFDVGDKPGTKGTVNISSGSQLRVNSAGFRIGGNEGSNTTSGTVNLSGGSLLTSKEMYTNAGGKGAAATFKMDNTSWAIISANSYALTFDNIKNDYQKGMLYVGTSADDTGILSHGIGSILLPGLTVNSGSTATINAPMAINSDSSITPNTSEFYIGYTTDSPDNKVVVNEGGILNTNQTISMGRNAGSFGELDIYGAMNATGTYLLMGYKGQGKIVLDGTNAALTAKNTIIGDNTGVAAGKTCGGAIDILNGATATLDRLSIGDKSTADGAVTVSGGAKLAVGANNFFVGNAGTGSLTVTGGSTVTAGAGIAVGYSANSGKTAKMSVTDSTVTVTGDLTVGQVSGSAGTLVIEGNSKVTSTGTLFAGKAGVGNVTLSDNAQVSVGTFFQSHDGSSTAGSFTIEDNATLSVTGSHLIFSRNSSGVATLKDNATINFSGTGVLGIDEQGGAGVLNIEGGTLNAIKPGNQGGFAIWNSGKIVQTGGVVNLGTIDSDTTNLILKSANARYELSGGMLNVTGALNTTGEGTGTNFAFSGGTLSANNINFDLTQTGGVLSPGIDWNNTGMAIGKTTINGKYTLVGTDALSPATLRLEIDLANNLADQIIVNGGGSLVFGDNSAINLVYDESLLKGNKAFELFASEGAVNMDSVIASLSARDQYVWNISQNESGGILFQVDTAAVPEPSTWALLVLGAAGLACWRKRRVPGRC